MVNVYRIYNQAIHVAKSSLTGPGFIADADLLEVGNAGMTFDEQATQFASWAMLKSALMISTDVSVLSDELVKVLQNSDLIAINQDSAVKPVQLFQRWTADRDVWVGQLANGDIAVLVVDLSNSARSLSLALADIGIDSADVKDLWTGVSTRGAVSYSKQVNGHGSMILRLSNVQNATTVAAEYNYVAMSTGSLASGANLQSCSGCTSSYKVGYIGGSNGGSVTLSNIQTSQTTQTVVFDYVNGDVGFLGGTNNERLASISVNGGTSQIISFPLSGYDWDTDVFRGYRVELSGFNTTGSSTITISGSGTAYAPDFDRIGIVA
jgi:alpha-galactosidase